MLTDEPLREVPLPTPEIELLEAVLTDAVLTDAVLTDAVLTDAVLTDAALTDPACADAAPSEIALAVADAQNAVALPQGASVDDSDRAIDIVDLLALEPFVSGRQPWSRSTTLEAVRTDAEFTPPGGTTARQSIEDTTRSALTVGPGWTLRSTHWLRTRRADLVVTAVNADLARTVLEAAARDTFDPVVRSDQQVSVGFWHLAAHGARYRQRAIEAPKWSEIASNYSAPVSAAVTSLTGLAPAGLDGRVLLLHGPPGTGKTTLLRSLAQAWRPWCSTDCVLDPDRLFSDPSYLLEVISAEPEDDDEELPDQGSRWRLLILEDCDELVRAEAKAATGQALSRLLNLTDGILGQGSQVLVALTTNERLSALHPALMRPGRCLAQLEVGRLSASESGRWLADRGVSESAPPGGLTLAELFARVGRTTGAGPIHTAPEGNPKGTGMYL